MKNITVQKKLKKAVTRFQANKKFKPGMFLDEVVETMASIGGITGFRVASHQSLVLRNHTAHYSLPVRFEEYSGRLSSAGKRQYAFLEGLVGHLREEGVSPREMEYHLGKDYASKHHARAF